MISVCIATYNGEKYIRRQLETILSQIGAADEVIVSDDGSNDSTIDIVRSINDSRIKIYLNSQEHGYTRNFENALKQASGEYIFLADQDDEWMPNKVERCMQVLAECDFVVSDAFLINETGEKIGDSFYSCRRPYKTFLGNILKFGFIGCCIAFRREILSRALPFPANQKLCTHDNWLTLVAMMFYRARVLDDKLVAYRRHGNNVSAGEQSSSLSIIFCIKYRSYLIYHLCKRLFR